MVYYQGKSDPSFEELGRKLDIEGAKIKQLTEDYGLGIDKAVKVCQSEEVRNRKGYEYEGKEYRSINRLAEELKLPSRSLAYWMCHCDTVEEAVKRCRKRQEDRILLWGKAYRNKREVSKAFGIRYQRLKTELEVHHKTAEETVLELLKTEPIRFEGKEYLTIAQLCCQYQVQPLTVYSRLRSGKTLHEAVHQKICPTGKKMKIIFEGKRFTNKMELCREYNISKICVESQWRCRKTKTFLECFALVKQLRDEINWPKDRIFTYIPTCKIEGVFYRSIEDFAEKNEMTNYQIHIYKCTHNCRDYIQTLKGMQAEGKPGYQTESGIYGYGELIKKGYTPKEISKLPYKPVGIPRYPNLRKYNFDKDCMDILFRYRELFGRSDERKKNKEIER